MGNTDKDLQNNKDRRYKVYVYTNKVNGKKYVGQTCRTLKERAGKDGIEYSTCPHFSNAIKKYGWENFQGNILFDSLSKSQANALEKKLISILKTTEREYGYNISIGGTGGNQRGIKEIYKYDLNGNFIEKYKSAAEAGRINNCDRSRITHCCKSKGKYKNYIYRYSGDIPSGTYTRKDQQTLLQYDLTGALINSFSSLSKMYESLHFNKSVISKAAKTSIRHYAYGYIWIYSNSVPKEKLNNYVNELTKLPIKQETKSVCQYDLNNHLISKFTSIQSAATQTGIPHTSIHNNCYGFIPSTHNYIFRFTELKEVA